LIGCRNCDIFFIFHLIGNLFLFKSILVVNLKKKQVSQSGWPLQNIHISNDNGSFTFYVDVFFLLSLPRLLLELTVYIWVAQMVSYKMQAGNAYPSASTWVHPRFLLGSVLLIFLVLCVVLLCVFSFWVPCCDVRYNFRIKTMFGSSLPPVVCRMAHVLLCFCVCLRIVMSNILPYQSYVFTFWVPCCDVCYDIRITTMFSSSLPPVVCRTAHVLIALFVFVCV
jgi:hypothetical protein